MRHLSFTALACTASGYAALLGSSGLALARAPDVSAPATEAQSAASAPSTEAAPPTPPRLLESVQPVYPESQRANGAGARVDLVLTLDETGSVTDAAVTQSGGADFDAAALSAARQLRFSPALLGEQPVAAKIPFRFDFQIEEPKPIQNVVVPLPVEPANDATLDVAVEGEREPREPTRQVLSGEEIAKSPGTNGDALRAVQNLPGLARPPGFDGLLIVRGSSPRDSQVFIDGTNVPNVYHFGGLSSVVPTEVLERIDFYPGNFGPEFGRASGGIIDVGVHSPKRENIGGLLQFDLIDGRILIEGPIGKDTRFLLGGRRSWVDAWLGPALEESGVQVSTAPVYYDYQAMIEHDTSANTTLRLFAFGSDDKLKLLLASPDSRDPAAGGDVGMHSAFWRLQGRVDTRLSERTRWRTTLSVGHDTEQFNSGSIRVDTGIYSLDLRSDLRSKLSSYLTTSFGVDIQSGKYDVDWRVPPFDIDSGDTSGPLFGRPLTELTAKGNLFRPSAYAQLELTPLSGLKILPGVRADYSYDTEDVTLDPRISLRYDLYPSELRTTLKGGVGVFHQAPEPYESIQPFGTPGVRSERAIHYTLGVEQELSRPVEVSAEGFYKQLDDRVVSAPDASSESGNAYTNTGTGRSYGAEFLLRYKPEGRFFGWVAYTLSRSERQDAPGAPYQLFEFDQTHILTALGSYKLGRGWTLGARFRYVTGSPYTPNVGGIMDHDAGVYSPLASEPEYGSRLPAFHQLDVRVDKTWEFRAWKLSAYLDVQNAYNRQNTENISYNYDYSQAKPLAGLPILPVLGIRGEL